MQARLLGARDMEGGITVAAVALDTRTNAFLLANVTAEAPSRRGDCLDRVDGLQKHCVGESDLGYPESAHNVRPLVAIGLLEGAALVWTQDTINGPTGTLQTPAAQPLTLRNVRDTVTVLVHCQIAHVTKEDDVRVLAFAVHAYATDLP